MNFYINFLKFPKFQISNYRPVISTLMLRRLFSSRIRAAWARSTQLIAVFRSGETNSMHACCKPAFVQHHAD